MTTAGLDLMPLRKEKDRAREGAQRTRERASKERRITGRVRCRELSLGVGWKSRIAVKRGAEGEDSSADLGILGNF